MELQKENKTKDRAKYQREYMKKRYVDNKEQGQNISKSYYYINRGDATKEEQKIYGENLPYVVKAKKALEILKLKNNVFFLELLQSYKIDIL